MTSIRISSTMLAAFLLISTSVSSLYGQKQQVKWEKDLQSARTKAEATGKPLLLHFWKPGCAACVRLDAYVFTDPEMGQQINQATVPVKLNAALHQDLIRKYEIRTVPHDVILSPKGDLIFKRNSPNTIRNFQQMLGMADKLLKRFSPQARQVLGGFSNQQKQRNVLNNQSPFIGKEAAKFGRHDARVANRYAGQPDKISLPEAGVKQGQHTPDGSFARSATGSIPPLAQQMTTSVKTASKQTSQLSYQNPLYSEPEASPNVQHANFGQKVNGLGKIGKVKTTGYQAPVGPQRNVIAQVSASSVRPVARPGLDGYCPVSLLRERKWVKGNKELGCHHRNKLYFFANREKAADFFDHPDRYSPLLAGFDPVTFAETGQLTDGLRKYGVFYKGPEGHVSIVLFQTPKNRDIFKSQRQKYLNLVKEAIERAKKQ